MRNDIKKFTENCTRAVLEWIRRPEESLRYTPEEAIKEWFAAYDPEDAAEYKDAMLEYCLDCLAHHIQP